LECSCILQNKEALSIASTRARAIWPGRQVGVVDVQNIATWSGVVQNSFAY
jgi:hypothetical protein